VERFWQVFFGFWQYYKVGTIVMKKRGVKYINTGGYTPGDQSNVLYTVSMVVTF
jgi:guanyl-specific ribonuclease Sa